MIYLNSLLICQNIFQNKKYTNKDDKQNIFNRLPQYNPNSFSFNYLLHTNLFPSRKILSDASFI